jgi:hypothetical protein
LLLVAVFIVSGCHLFPENRSSVTFESQSDLLRQNDVRQQLIIKFKPNTVLCSEAGIAQFSSAIQVGLSYVRPMSGQACVVLQSKDNDGGYVHGQAKIRKHPAVELLELDAMMKAY